MNQNSTPKSSTTPLPTIAALPPPDPLEELNTIKARLRDAEARVTDLVGERNAFEENQFIFALRNLDAGGVMIEAGGVMGTLCADVLRRQEKGSLTLKIEVKPFKGEALIFVGAVKVTPPKPEAPQSVFYATADGKLTRNDPRQMELRIR